jgi:prepilin-type processing-associated H-X9-DG protein
MHTLLTPNAEDADGGFGRAANVGNLGECNSGCMSNARSNHGGGANVLLMDGTVKFVDDSIDQEIWWGVGSIYGGETKGKADL